MTSLYILTDELNEGAGRFKVGIHSGEVTALIKRYRTPMPTVSVRTYLTMADGKAKELEDQIKSEFAVQRIVGTGDKTSELYQVPLKTLYTFIGSRMAQSAPSLEDEKKVQDKLDSMNNAMNPIKNALETIEKNVPQNWQHSQNRSMQDLHRETRLEFDAFHNGTFKGEHMTKIYDRVLEIYLDWSSIREIGDIYFGFNISHSLYEITVAMDVINRLQPGKFKKVPRIIKLDLMKTDKNDLIYQQFVMFASRCNIGDEYIKKHWKNGNIRKLPRGNWQAILNLNGKDPGVSPKTFINKNNKSKKV